MSEYDVFLSHNSADQEAVELIARRLREEARLEPFLDRWHLVPGEPWQEALEEALDTSRSCAVFLGPAGLGTWENEEMRAALDIRAGRPDFRVIPVLLPGARLPERGRLPRFLARLTWVDFRPGLDDARAFRELICGVQGIAPGPEGVAEGEAVCPFRGLQVFDEEHARFFFGREALTQHLVEQLREDRFLAVIGPSGSGKSSLVRAGLVPQVRGGALPSSDRWPVALFKPGPHPLETLAARLVPHLNEGSDPLAARESLLDALGQDERGLHGAVQVALASAPDSARLLLVVDQFEELFTLCHDETARASFVANLLYASAIAGGQAVAVVTMRADFFGKCAAYPELAARLAERDVLVGPMSEEELRRAVEAPAEAVGLHYEKGLVNTILDDLGSEPGMLPLLQHTLLELWERRRGGWLTTDAYHEIGGVQGALAQRADEIYGGLTPAQREATRRVLLRLTQPGEGTEDTRRRATLAELLPAEGGATDVEAAVRELADARLLTTGEDEEGAEIVDVAHEALIRGWPRLQQWIDEDRAALRTHRRLTEAAEEWEKGERDEGYLYRGARLAEAEEWAETHAADLNPLEQEFLEASVALRDREAQEAERRRQKELEQAQRLAEEQRKRAEEQAQAATQLRKRALWLGGALILATIAMVVAVWLGRQAENRRVEAVRQQAIANSRTLATHAESVLDDDPELAALLGLEAVYQTQQVSPGTVTAEASSVLYRAMARIWGAETGQVPFILNGHDASVDHAAWNTDGSRILTASADGAARVWDAETGTELLTLSGYRAWWNADGSRILTASGDGRARVWDAETGVELLMLTLPGSVAWYGWNADESRILTANDDGTAKVWDARTGQELVVLNGHRGGITHAAWDAEGQRVVTVGCDQEESSGYKCLKATARVWDAQTGQELLVLSGHQSRITHVAWSPDGMHIATASLDRTAKVWDVQTGQELFTITGHALDVIRVEWDGKGERIMTASTDGSVKVWDAETGQKLLTNLSGSDGVWDNEYRRIVTLSNPTRPTWDAKVWDAQTGQELLTFSGHGGNVNHAAWDGEGRRIVIASSDGSAQIYFANVDDLVEFACANLKNNIDWWHWDIYMGSDVLRRKTCPNLPLEEW